MRLRSCAEWSWGGYPYDLSQIPGIATRSSNAQWEAWMSAFLLNITREFRDDFADRGGPIVLAQVENELHTSDQAYVDFCGQLAAETGTAIPWEMCNGNSASTTINSCNGGDCTGFIEENGQNGKVLITQPALWTENCAWGSGGVPRRMCRAFIVPPPPRDGLVCELGRWETCWQLAVLRLDESVVLQVRGHPPVVRSRRLAHQPV